MYVAHLNKVIGLYHSQALDSGHTVVCSSEGVPVLKPFEVHFVERANDGSKT